MELTDIAALVGIVGGIVSASTIYLRQFMAAETSRLRDEILTRVNTDYVKKDIMELRLNVLQSQLNELRKTSRGSS